ncbi:MAG: hypothetical protein PHS45_02675 [Bacilli bacterium]|nr:hypothetical protein [Bacilli bacterium]
MQKITKKIAVGMMTLLFIFGFAPNVFAATAYSVGTLYAPGTNHAGDDFRQNVTNARNAYALISDISSYYNHQPTYTYVNSTTRLGNSRVFFINGHSNNLYITLGYANTTEGRTGVSIYTNGWTSGSGYKTAGLDSRSMSGTTLITFVGCETAGYVGNPTNLTDKAVNKGAKVALGWYHTIHSRVYNGPQWLVSYNGGLGGGLSVINSIYRAKVAWPSSDLSDFYAYRGNRDLTIGTSTQPLSAGVSMSSIATNYDEQKNVRSHNEALQLISDTYKVVDTSIMELKPINKVIRNEELSNYTTLFSDIIDKIKTQDSSFNPNDYKVTYHVANDEDGYGDIYFRYYIDGKIETNKVYIATFDNFKITDIVLGGVTIANMGNVKNISMNNINAKIATFENNKTELLLEKAGNMFHTTKKANLVKTDNKVDISSLKGNIIELEESYFYDYNTKELKYLLKTVENIDGLYDAGGIEIAL